WCCGCSRGISLLVHQPPHHGLELVRGLPVPDRRRHGRCGLLRLLEVPHPTAVLAVRGPPLGEARAPAPHGKDGDGAERVLGHRIPLRCLRRMAAACSLVATPCPSPLWTSRKRSCSLSTSATPTRSTVIPPPHEHQQSRVTRTSLMLTPAPSTVRGPLAGIRRCWGSTARSTRARRRGTAAA